MTDSAQEALDQGVIHYRNGHFELAAQSLQEGLDAVGDGCWDYRFYLGMTLARLENNADARRVFMNIRDLCPDPEMRKRAETALYAIGKPTSH